MTKLQSKTTKGHPTSASIARAVKDLRVALCAQYGCDFAFTVMAKGNLIAAANARNGVVLATTGK